MSTSYHPQTDGQIERVNQCLEAYLKCFVHACPNQWKQWLPLAEFWYNASFHTSLNSTPFEILYGQQPRHLGIDVIDSCAIPDVHVWLKERHVMVQLLQQQLLRAQQRQKAQADIHFILEIQFISSCSHMFRHLLPPEQITSYHFVTLALIPS
jgi:hypothetical protein